ncbi:MAG: hypothetical protein JNJ40_12645 [Bacteroidia bacterium]|nr:hypothetical protein [Bacteroidia bacterium]
MITYPQIQKIYGTPLEHLSRPHQPFKLKTGHYIAGGIIISLAIFGAYKIVSDFRDKPINNSVFKFKTKV